MGQYGTDGVRLEQRGWRDQTISNRHRLWGYPICGVDVDFLMIEYYHGRPMALVEYKRWSDRTRNGEANGIYHSRSYDALRHMANKAEIPAFIALYTDDCSRFLVRYLNRLAIDKLGGKPEVELTEKEWVRLLYDIRGVDVISDEVLRILQG